MPYRRLPNTDRARARALSNVIKKYQEHNINNIEFSEDEIAKAESYLHSYEKVFFVKEDKLKIRSQEVEVYHQAYKKAKMFVSHYYHMLNMAIMRQELPSDTKSYYVDSPNDKLVPRFRNETDLIEAAERLFIGDQKRISNRGKYLTNPSIGVVKVWYEKFYTVYQERVINVNHQIIDENFLEELRTNSDTLIKTFWNRIESSFIMLPEILKREESAKYGVAYVYRKSERKRLEFEENNCLFTKPEIIKIDRTPNKNVEDNEEKKIASHNINTEIYDNREQMALSFKTANVS